MTTVEELVTELAEQNPDDADDLQDALELLQKQRLTTCERLAKLNDSQWQRLGVPIGIEAILRDAIEAVQRDEVSNKRSSPAPPTAEAPVPARKAPAPVQSTTYDESDDGELPLEPVEIEGLRRRGGKSGGGATRQVQRASQNREESGERKGLLSPLDLTPPDDLDLLWQQLLEDTLPPDKRAALQDSWEQTPGDHDKYMMFLEYSSYLRKPEITEEEKEERRKQLAPLMKEFGLPTDEEEAGTNASIWCVIMSVILFVAGLIYYSQTMPEAILHDTQVL